MELRQSSFKSALNGGKLVILACRCSVTYSGRAESFLAEGDRLIIIKSDKTLLIHQPSGSNPINYMKESSNHQLAREGEKWLIRSRNLLLKEFIQIEISKVHSLQILELSDSAKIQLRGSEKDMADMIYDNPALISPDFRPLSREERTKYGFIDVFGHDSSNNLVVVECKRDGADFNAVDQLLRYIKKIRQMRGIENVRGVIAAPKISENALKMLKDHGCEFKAVNPPKYHEKYNKSQKNILEF